MNGERHVGYKSVKDGQNDMGTKGSLSKKGGGQSFQLRLGQSNQPLLASSVVTEWRIQLGFLLGMILANS